jgi:uncharacterized protein YjbJ (UPF0337 family)
MSLIDKAKNKLQWLTGKVKELAGRATGRQESAGRGSARPNQVRPQDAGAKVKDAFRQGIVKLSEGYPDLGGILVDRTTGVDQRLRGYRFPAIVIGEVVWLRFRFNLSLRDIPDLMAARGVVLSPSDREGLVRHVRCGLRQGSPSAPAPAG